MSKVMLVEDDVSCRVLVKILLEKMGYDVDAFGSAEDALKSNDTYSMILTDYELPGKNGFEVIPLYRQKNPSVYVIGMSSKDKISELNLVDDFLKKPVRRKNLEVLLGSCDLD